MPLTYAIANTYLNHLVRGGSLTSLTPYIGLSTTAPNREGKNVTEPPESAGYARMPLTSRMEYPSLGFSQNNEIIYFPEATASWGTCTHYVIFAGSATNQNALVLAYGALDNPITPEKGKLSIIPIDSLRLSLG